VNIEFYSTIKLSLRISLQQHQYSLILSYFITIQFIIATFYHDPIFIVLFSLNLVYILIGVFSLFLLQIFFNFQTWTQHKEGDPWPGSRWYHTAACVGYGGPHQRLVISGGGGGTKYDDMWILDSESGKMEKVRIALVN